MTDYAIQRTNMVESQVRPSDISDRRIPRAMQEIAREAFAPGPRKPIAYADRNLPLTQAQAGGDGRVLLAPRTLAKLIQSLDIASDDAVLDIGGGTGYSAAILARLARSVVAVEEDKVLAGLARAALKATGADGVVVVEGPLAEGAAAQGPYDAILVNGAIETLPRTFIDQLKDGGRLVAIVVEGGVGRATLWRRYGTQADARALFDASAPALPGFSRERAFEL